MFVQSSDAYVAGYSTTNNKTQATYWKNSIPTILSGDGTQATVAFGITVIGTDVYVAGNEYDADGNSTAVYWKNGSINHIEGNAYAFSMTNSGSDIYILDNSDTNLSYWKNGTVTQVTANSVNINAHESAIAVTGADVYIAGAANNLATYWKNGKAINIYTKQSAANAIVVLPKIN